METNNPSVDEAREYAESIINTVREPLIVLDHDLRVVTASRSFYKVFKVNPEETVGQLVYDLGNKQWDIPKLRELLETILPQKTTFDGYEVEHDFAAIGRRTMLLNARQIERVLGKERIILLAIEDITERRQLEILLADSEKRYRRLFETANDGILLLEKSKGNITQANPAIMSMLGYSSDEFYGKSLRDVGFPDNMGTVQELLQALEQNGIIHYKDTPIQNRTGQVLYSDIYMVDKADLVQCNIRDITERKQAEAASRDFLHSIINTMADPVFVKDSDRRFVLVNDALCAIVGRPREGLIGEDGDDMFPEEETAVFRRIDDIVLDTGRENVNEEYLTNLSKKETRTIVTRKTRYIDPFGKKFLVGVIRDITEHRKLEAQLRQSQKMEAVGTLAGGIAHDFNNILNVIMGYGVMVKDTLDPGSPEMEDMNEVLIAADRAAELTQKLLVFSRKEIVEVRSVNINELILDLQKMLVRMIRESIEFNLDLMDRPLKILADAGGIEQVLINLAANARDAMPEGGRMTISTGLATIDEEFVAAYGYGRPGKYACITVSDTGKGMNAEIQKKIFEPFFTTKGVGEGTGLGLAISYGIIKQHHGFMKVYSEPDQGTVFKIFLPLSEETTTGDKKAEADAPVRGGNETVLIAEDEASLRKLTKTILESFGYSVITAKNGEDAITKFMESRKRISLVLLDMIMPKKSGKEVSEAIVKIAPRMKVLFASGYAMDNITNKEMTASDFDFIHKPFRPKDLLIKVREVLDR